MSWVTNVGYDNTGKVYSVGYYDGERFIGLLRCDDLFDAMELVNYLNGGVDNSEKWEIGENGSDAPIRLAPES